MLKIPFFRLGVWQHPAYGELRIDQAFLDRLLANFKAGLPGSRPFVRLGHDKDAADAKSTFGDTPALAWVQELVQEGPVVYALAEPTDPKVPEWIRTKQYRYASAEYDTNHISKETGKPVGPVLCAIGLTNEPFLTHLPESVVLAAGPDTFYLDCKEARRRMKFADLIKKLGAMAGLGEIEVDDIPDSIQVRAQLAAQQEEQRRLSAQLEIERRARRESEVEKLATDLVREGIPPAMINKVRPLLLADTGAKIGKIQLANGQEREATQTELIVESLRSLPANQRVLFGQAGAQDDTAGDRQAKIKATADADVLAMGGTITADGKYKL